MQPIGEFSLIVPYYRNVGMLREQLRVWTTYPQNVKLILVDDGSPEPALDIVKEHASPSLRSRLWLYRIQVDIPWNRGGARNLGTMAATTKWIVHLDIDHIMPLHAVQLLLWFKADPQCWYRFERFRRGRADATRRKDKIPDDQEYGKIHPHVDSYLCQTLKYWEAGGYDEDYSGCLGGGGPFLKQLEQVAGPARLAPESIHTEVFTRSVVADASDHTLSRDRSEYSRRRKLKEAAGTTRGINPIRFAWRLEDAR